MSFLSLKNLMAALALLVGVACALCVLVATPIVWQPLYPKVMGETMMQYEKGPLYLKDEKQISRALWSREGYAAVSERLVAYHLETKEIEHYEDVRNLLHGALALAVGIAILLVVLRKRIHWQRAWLGSFALALILAAANGIWMAIAWRHWFRTLHWWIFQDDSWILPDESYTLFLYQHAVWKVAGGGVVGGTLVTCLAGYAVACLIRLKDRRMNRK